MSALQSAKLTAEMSRAFPGVDPTILRNVLSTFFWKWYGEHQGDTVVRRTILVFKVTVKVRDLYPLFIMLFGEPPVMIGG